MRARALVASAGAAGLVIAGFGLTGCGQHSSTAATPADRAACTQLGTAYATVNGSLAAPAASAVYRRAISVATRADNRRLGTAIVGWVTAMQRPTGVAVQGAPYATSECRRIGIPVQLHVPGTGPNAGTTPASGSPTSKPDGGDGSDSDGGND